MSTVGYRRFLFSTLEAFVGISSFALWKWVEIHQALFNFIFKVKLLVVFWWTGVVFNLCNCFRGIHHLKFHYTTTPTTGRQCVESSSWLSTRTYLFSTSSACLWILLNSHPTQDRSNSTSVTGSPRFNCKDISQIIIISHSTLQSMCKQSNA